MKKKKPDFISQLIEVSDRCMTFTPRFTKDGKMVGHPCNCRENVKKILRKMGVKV